MKHSSTPAVGRDYATTSLPLEALSIHPSNVRRTAPDSAAMHELMASIVAHGLLMPLLVVHQMGMRNPRRWLSIPAPNHHFRIANNKSMRWLATLRAGFQNSRLQGAISEFHKGR